MFDLSGLRHLTRRHIVGILLFLVALGSSVALGILSGADKQPTRATSALLVVIAAGFQFASAWTFYGIGRADPGLARASVRRLIQMARRAQQARILAETANESAAAADSKKAMGRISVELSWLEEGLTEAVEDWAEFHREELRKLTEGSSGAGTS